MSFNYELLKLIQFRPKFLRAVVSGFIFILLNGCEKQNVVEFNKAQEILAKGETRSASALFERIMQKEGSSELSLRAARELLKINLYDFKDYDRAISQLRFLVRSSKDATERIKAQKQIAQIFFDNKVQYENAVVEFSRLLNMPLAKLENIEIRLSIARAYYHLGNFEQSWREAFSLSTITEIPENFRYDIKLLQANIKMAQKDHTSAARMYEDLMSEYPSRANKENIPLNLSLCYEVGENFEKAIDILKPLIEFYKPPEFIALKIKKLSERQQNRPKERIKK